MLKLSLRSESCKHSCMLWGASAINPGKANGFGFDPWGDLFLFCCFFFFGSYSPCIPNISFCILFSTLFFFYHLVSNLLISAFYLTVCLSSPLPPARKLSPSLSLWCLPMRSVVGGLMFSQVGEGHFSQMDMSCGAMPSQLHWREPWGLEQSKPGRHWERGEVENYLWSGEAALFPGLSWSHGRDGPGDKEMERVKKRWQSWCCWQTNI